jgi:hypothetical protein
MHQITMLKNGPVECQKQVIEIVLEAVVELSDVLQQI